MKITTFVSILCLVLAAGTTAAAEDLSLLESLYEKTELNKHLADLESQLAKKPDDPKLLLRFGIVHHNLGVVRVMPSVDKACEALEKAHAKGKRPLALAYLGSAITLQGRAAAERNDVFTASAKVETGLAKIEEALKAAAKEKKDQQSVHILRMMNAVNLSEESPFDRYKVVKVDLDWLGGRLAGLNPGTKAIYHYSMAMYLKKNNKIDESFKSFEACIKVDRKSFFAKKSEKILDELEE